MQDHLKLDNGWSDWIYSRPALENEVRGIAFRARNTANNIARLPNSIYKVKRWGNSVRPVYDIKPSNNVAMVDAQRAHTLEKTFKTL